MIEELGLDLKLIIPFLVLQGILVIAALYDLFKNQREMPNKWVWVVIVVVVNIIGPIIYFTVGRKAKY
ncbi:PLDc N-terminal domain-containing protein [Paenibacillus eucommiae]|uniref:Membrane channel-forming protein YqfA (Hemolysin III family) n=1 Tax=Paenibacillus eucommiae TaxID=1355755 RepID=A0ABS4IR51_9BACL|nr:PLDc N-terminal domain-containing protein [Paenibacillus eucommiae]MBP1990045.1 putative membrane channel-forming protein YqfA (hemolysin III family) [Paenibacillus eucommiae]